MSQRRQDDQRHGPGVASIGICMLLVAISAAPVAAGHVPTIDWVARSWADAHQSSRAIAVLDAIIRLAHWSTVCAFLIVVAGSVTAVQRSLRPLKHALTAVAFLVLVTWTLKAATGRPGPTGAPPPPYDGAWPSGHALTLVVATVVVVQLLPGSHASSFRRTVVALLPAAFLSVALVYRGHHWFTDVTVAFPLGLAIVWTACWLCDRTARDIGSTEAPRA